MSDLLLFAILCSYINQHKIAQSREIYKTGHRKVHLKGKKDFIVYIFHQKTHYNIPKKNIPVCINMASSLLKLPVELVYRILDNLDEKAMFLSIRNVCTRLNTIIDTYHRYQVNFSFILKLAFHLLRNTIHSKKIILYSPLLCSF